MLDGWQKQAACLGVNGDVFFPPMSTTSDRKWNEARAICKRCPVKQKCLDLALRFPEIDDRWGMFGGMTPRERSWERYLREQRRKNGRQSK